MSRLLSPSLLVLLIGCNGEEGKDPSDTTPEVVEPVDSDKDGLTDDEESTLGSDPQNADSDGDLINDGAEVDQGLDPQNVDTDGDTYQDNWELDVGTEPLDPESRIYTGYWPYNPDKAAFVDRTWDDAGLNEGDMLPYDAALMDQWGDTVELYDFAGQGKYVLVDISAIWCGPCQEFADWLAGGPDPYNFEAYYPHIREGVENKDFYWITILGDDMNSGYDVDLEDLELWYDAFEDPHIPVLADDGGGGSYGNAAGALLSTGWPTMVLFDENLELVQAPANDYYAALTELEQILSAE